jgi:hypothetical protein
MEILALSGVGETLVPTRKSIALCPVPHTGLDHQAVWGEIKAHEVELREAKVLSPERERFHVEQIKVRQELIVADTVVNTLREGAVRAKPFVFYPEAQPGKTFYVHAQGSAGWLCETHKQNAAHVPPYASQILVAVRRMPYPIGDVRVAKAVSVLPLEHPSLGDVMHRQIIRTRDGLIRAVRQTGRAVRRAAETIRRTRDDDKCEPDEHANRRIRSV